MPQPQPRTAGGKSPDSRFREQIARAVADGVPLEGMVLRLTLQDASRLARDHTIPVADISYRNGLMHFLGVRVESGSVAASTLDLPPA